VETEYEHRVRVVCTLTLNIEFEMPVKDRLDV